MTEARTFTAREKMRAIQREIGLRRYVYPKKIAAGKMSKAKADEEIAIMEAIALDYGARAKEEERALNAEREIAEALASERQRGLAEGERIGIEKAAKYLESLIGPNDNSVSVRMADLGSMANHIRQRALNFGTSPEVDPNAWAFKHGLEST